MEAERIPPGPTRSVLPVVKESAVPEDWVDFQGITIHDGVRLVLVVADTPQLEWLLDQLTSPQPIPLVGDVRILVVPLVIHLHHLAPGEAVAAGAPGAGPGSEGCVILIVLPQRQGIGIQSISSGVEEHGQLPLGQ